MHKPKPKIRVVTASGQRKVGTVYLFGHFSDGDPEAISSKGFIEDFQTVQDSDKIVCKVHSSGGDVFLGTTIMDVLDQCGKPVEFRIMGIAASMGYQVCLVKNARIGIAKNGFIMVHWPSAGGGTSQDLKNHLKLLENIENEFATRLSARTGLSIEEVRAKFGQGDNWFSAEEALKAKLVDFIFDTTTDVGVSDPTALDSKTLMARFTAQLLNKKPSNFSSMKKVIAHLGLGESASEETILASIKTLELDRKVAQDQVTALTTSNKALNDKVAEFEAKEKENRAVALVEKAVTEGRIGPGEKAQYLALAKQNEESFNGVKAILEAKTPRSSVVDAAGSKTSAATVEISAKSWDDLFKQSGALDKLKASDPDTYKALFKAKYGTEPKS